MQHPLLSVFSHSCATCDTALKGKWTNSNVVCAVPPHLHASVSSSMEIVPLPSLSSCLKACRTAAKQAPTHAHRQTHAAAQCQPVSVGSRSWRARAYHEAQVPPTPGGTSSRGRASTARIQRAALLEPSKEALCAWRAHTAWRSSASQRRAATHARPPFAAAPPSPAC